MSRFGNPRYARSGWTRRSSLAQGSGRDGDPGNDQRRRGRFHPDLPGLPLHHRVKLPLEPLPGPSVLAFAQTARREQHSGLLFRLEEVERRQQGERSDGEEIRRCRMEAHEQPDNAQRDQ